MRPIPASSRRGVTLVEVLVALVLLAVAVVAVAGLALLSARALEGGGRVSQATALASGVLEETESLSFDGLYRALGAADTSTTAQADSLTDPWASRFQPRIASLLHDGHAVITLTPLSASGPAAFGSCTAIRVRVAVEWREALRLRRAELQTVRF